MKYLLDISCLDTYSSGAKQRVLTLYSELIKANRDSKFLVIYTSFTNIKKIFKYPNVSFKKNPFSQEKYLKKIVSILFLFFFMKLRLKKIDVVEFFTLPFFKIKNSKIIITIHDLRKIYFSQFFLNKLLLKFFYKYFLFKTNKIIVVSKAIKNEIIKNFGKLKIEVIYNTIDQSFLEKINKNEIIKIKKKYDLPDTFMLTVGHQEKRKNLLCLVKAMNILKINGQNKKLVIIGKKADQSDEIKRLINKLKLNSNKKIFSNLNDLEVRCFYQLAKLFIFPSNYEGFGIPILESMASNLPMVLSNTEIFREITQNKYIYFDQHDPLSIASKIEYVLLNKQTQIQMINYGKKRIKHFTLNTQRKKIIKFYRKLN